MSRYLLNKSVMYFPIKYMNSKHLKMIHFISNYVVT